MPKAVYVVYSCAAAPEKEAEYHRWYDEVHVPEVCAVPGVVGARRFSPVGESASGDLPMHLSIYEIDDEDPESVVRAIASGARNGTIHMSDAISMSPPPAANLFIER